MLDALLLIRTLVGLVVPALIVASAHAQDRERLAAHPRGDAEVIVDGRLDEPVWSQAAEGGSFTMRRPTPGLEPPVATRFRVLFDDEALYVGAVMELLPGETPRALELRRDRFEIFADDALSIKIDVARDRRTTVGFVVNPAGTQLDYVAVDNGAQFRNELDAVWESATSIEEHAWIAELRIPMAALGLSDEPGARVLGFNVTRDHNARFATYDWNEIPDEFGPVSALHYGDLEGVRMGGGRPLALLPYVLATVPRQETFGPIAGNVRAGGDVRLRIGEDVWSELTILTDFAQVDLDDPVVNLDRFPLFFPEKRPFFLTGLEIFELGQQGEAQLFFSRRIGLDEDGNEVPMLGGLKVYGHAGRVGFGILDVLTADPLTNWGVARVRVNATDTMHVGVMGTYRDDFDLDGRSAAAGADASMRFFDERLVLDGAYSTTELLQEAMPEDVDPDLDTGRRSDRGSGVARARWLSDAFRPELSFLWVGDDFEPDVGFVRRRGLARTALRLPVILRPPGVRDVEIAASGAVDTTDEMRGRLGAVATLGVETRFESWGARATGGFLEDVVEEPFALLGDIPIAAGAYRGATMEYALYVTSENNPHGSVSYRGSSAFFGGVLHSARASAGASFGPHLRLSLSTTQSVVQLPGIEDRYTSTLRSAVTITPSTRLSLDTIVQLTEVSDGNQNDVLAAIARLRWRYLPGSDLFLVGRIEDTPEAPPDWRVTLKASVRYDALL